MCLGQNTVNETFVCNNTEMKNVKEEKILGVIIDDQRCQWFWDCFGTLMI